MSSEVFVVSRATINPGIESMTLDANQNPADGPSMSCPPTEFVTENGFSIMRISDLQTAAADSMSECHFLVRAPHGEETEAMIGFAETAIAQAQRQRRTPLSATSLFWLTLAEQQLATYLLKNEHCPAGERLTVGQLSDLNLVVAARWVE